MNLLDIIILVLIGLSVFEGLRKGLTRQVFELVGIIAAFFLAVRFGQQAGEFISNLYNVEPYLEGLNNPLLNLENAVAFFYNGIGYLAVFVLVVIASKIAAIALSGVTKLPIVGTADRLGGLAAGLLKGLLTTLILVWVLSLLPLPAVEEAMANSPIAQGFLRTAPGIYERVQEAIVGYLPGA
ncbi:MAG: CvpA family protein [Firmicutes bacterium]|nr:CvpA family protein [Bacillota bacterium]